MTFILKLNKEKQRDTRNYVGLKKNPLFDTLNASLFFIYVQPDTIFFIPNKVV